MLIFLYTGWYIHTVWYVVRMNVDLRRVARVDVDNKRPPPLTASLTRRHPPITVSSSSVTVTARLSQASRGEGGRKEALCLQRSSWKSCFSL